MTPATFDKVKELREILKLNETEAEFASEIIDLCVTVKALELHDISQTDVLKNIDLLLLHIRLLGSSITFEREREIVPDRI